MYDKNFHIAVFWGRWSPWSKCSATCGKGYQIRRRLCYRRCPWIVPADVDAVKIERESAGTLQATPERIPANVQVVSPRYCPGSNYIERRPCYGAGESLFD